MENEQKFVVWLVVGLLILSLLSLGGCDYWPPALQAQLEEIRAYVQDLSDERMKLIVERDDALEAQRALREELETLSRSNRALREQLATAQKTLRLARRDPSGAGAGAPARVAGRKPGGKGTPVAWMGSSRFLSQTTALRLSSPPVTGPDVRFVQRSLRTLGLPVRPDGVYGPNTAASVKWFQRKHGLHADGIVGPETHATIVRARIKQTKGERLGYGMPGARGPAVRLLQEALRRYNPALRVTGRFDRATEAEVKRFQRRAGLYPDGVVGPATWRALGG